MDLSECEDVEFKSTSVGWLLAIEGTIESSERRLCPPGSELKPRLVSSGFGPHPFFCQCAHCDAVVSPFRKRNGANWGAPPLPDKLGHDTVQEDAQVGHRETDVSECAFGGRKWTHDSLNIKVLCTSVARKVALVGVENCDRSL